MLLRNIAASLLDRFREDSFAPAQLFIIERPDGEIARITDHDEIIIVDEEEYRPDLLVEVSAYSAKINGPIDECELTVAIDGDVFVADDFRKSLYSGGTVTVYMMDWEEQEHTPHLHRMYDIGATNLADGKCKINLRGIENRLERNVEHTLTANCKKVFGSQNIGHIGGPGNMGCEVRLDVPDWAAETEYTRRPPRDDRQGSIVKPSEFNGFWYRCNSSGISGTDEPTWPTSIDGTVSDGGVQWRAIYARKAIGTVATVEDIRTITATGIDFPPQEWWEHGLLEWVSGLNAGTKLRVREDDGEGKLVFYVNPFEEIQVGDTFEVTAGCQKRKEDCIKFDNVHRFGGYEDLILETATSKTPIR